MTRAPWLLRRVVGFAGRGARGPRRPARPPVPGGRHEPRARATRPVRRAVRGLIPTLLLGSGGCELQDVMLAEAEDVVVAEVLVQLRADAGLGDRPRVFALLHRTVGTAQEGVGVPGARVVIRRAEGSFVLAQTDDVRDCVGSTPEDYGGTCYRASRADEERLEPGEELGLEIELPDGRRLEGFTGVPGDFRFRGAFRVDADPWACRLAPDTTFELRWARSDGAWAYVAETALQGIKEPLAERGIEIDRDELRLLGLAVSQADTSIVFPAEFGLLERLEGERDVLVALQGGLPPGARARITVAAVERNYVNWARGGAFNPSGQVRVSSLRGEGMGFFGAAVVRALDVEVPPQGAGGVEVRCP